MRVIIALGFFSQWSGNGLVSYYINIILEVNSTYASVTSTSFSLLVRVLVCWCQGSWNQDFDQCDPAGECFIQSAHVCRYKYTLYVKLFNFAMAITSALFVDRIGRRTLFLISNTGMLIGELIAHCVCKQSC